MSEESVLELRDVLTSQEPLGPRSTEEMLNHPDAFQELYEQKANLADSLNSGRPAYIVGRKGAGKTAFLMGEGLASQLDVISIRAENAFSILDQLRLRWEAKNGVMPVDHMVYLWEAVLIHGAMRGTIALGRPADATRAGLIKRYLQSVTPGLHPSHLGDAQRPEDEFLTALGETLERAIDEHSGPAAIRDLISRIGTTSVSYTVARQTFADMLRRPERGKGLCVVVDNLEDLHRRVDAIHDVLAGLFRIVSRVNDPTDPVPLPFELRFAFPAEMTSKLRQITANPEKDFKNRLVIEWTAAELINLAGTRLQKSIAINLRAPSPYLDTLMRLATPEEVLRQVLPDDDAHFINGLRQREDPVAYIMRHTQLLPRHLIQILNESASPMFTSKQLRRLTPSELVSGVRKAEGTIVQGIMASYSNEYPLLLECLERLKNQLPEFAFSERTLRDVFNRAGVKRATGVRFDEFVFQAINSGAFGIQRTETERYLVADFSYTFEGSLHPMQNDTFCTHPLFVHELHDSRSLSRILAAGHKPIYPYGSGYEDER